MRRLPVLAILLFLLSVSISASAEEKTGKGPGITMGVTGMFGTSTMDAEMSDVDPEAGYIAGGGILLEKSIARYLSVGSGVQYRYFKNDFTMTDETTLKSVDVTWTFQGISVPFHFIATVRGPASSVDLHAGITYTYIYSSKMATNDTMTSGMERDDVMRFTNASQVAASGGVIFRFMVTEYTDFFMGVMAEYYFTDLISDSSGKNMHLLNYSFNTGYMFRTDFF